MGYRVKIDTVGAAVQNLSLGSRTYGTGSASTHKEGLMRSQKRRPFALPVVVVIVLGTAMGRSASSQSLTGPAAIGLGAQPGARVRVFQPDSATGSQAGTVVAVGQDGMTVRRDHPGDSLAIGFARIDRLDLSRGRHGHALIGLGIGVVGGALVGGALGASSGNSNGYQIFNKHDDAILGAVLGGLAGAVVGPVIGALVRTERWRTVWLRSAADHAHASLDLMPYPAGPRLGLRVVAGL
jgi:hypothetical protein